MSLPATFYDGQTSQPRNVELQAYAGTLTVAGDGIRRSVPLAQLTITEQLGSAPRLIRFRDGAFCEVRDPAGLATLLQRLGHREGRIDRWQRSTQIALASTALVVVAIVCGYVYGLPWVARKAAAVMPPAVDEALSREVLEALDRGMLEATELPRERRVTLERRFLALRRPEQDTAVVRLRFGRIDMLGANAFALPDGTVVLLDDMVKICDHDEQVYAVLAHELGHVHYRHGQRLLLQGSFVGAVAAWWFGDISGLLAAAPAALLQARYSRDFEAEADHYAALMLKANGMAPARLAEALEKLVAAHGVAKTGSGWLDYLASHPAPQERLEALRRE